MRSQYIKSILAVTLSAVSVSALAADKLRSISTAEIAAACEKTDEIVKKLDDKKGEVQEKEKVATNSCIRKVEEYYEAICGQKPELCKQYAVNGFIIWLSGAEVNLPGLRLLYVKQSRFDARGAIGISYLGLQTDGTNKPAHRVGVVVQPAVNLIIDKISSAPGGAPVEGDTFQIVKGGVTLILVPRGKLANLTPENLFVVANSKSISSVGSVLRGLYQSQVGFVAEGKTTGQSDAFQTNSWLFVGSTNLHGAVTASHVDEGTSYLANLVGFDISGWAGEHHGNAFLISGYKLNGKIRTENKGFSIGPIIELFNLTSK